MNNRRLVIAILFLSIFAMAARIVIDPDVYWHLAVGKHILNTKTIPTVDIFSFTLRGEPWQGSKTGWIIQIPLYILYNQFGPGSLYIVTAGLVTLAFIFIYKSLSGGVFLRAFTLIFAAVTSGVYWSPRPYMVTFVLTAVFLWILEDYHHRRSNRLIWLPILFPIWVNSHAGQLIGFVLLGVYGFAEGVDWFKQKEPARIGRMIKTGLWMILAGGIGPGGYTALLYPLQTLKISGLKELVAEWQSPNFNNPMVFPYLAMILIMVLVLGISQKKIRLTDFLLLSGFLYLSLTSQRNIALFALVAPVVLTRHLAPITQTLGEKYGYFGLTNVPPPRLQKVLNYFIVFILIFVAFLKSALVFSTETYQMALEQAIPVNAINNIRTNQPEGRMFNSYNFGGYLIFDLPEYPVFIDGRTDLYGDEMIEEWASIISAKPGWQDKLEKWDIQIIFIEPHWNINLLLPDHGWKILYQDSIAVIYVPE